MSFVRPLMLAAALVSGAAGSFAQAVIDNFEQNQGAGTVIRAGGMLGGERDIAVSAATAQVKGGALLFNTAAGGSAEVVWDGTDADAGSVATGGLASVDLTGGGQDALLLGVNSSDAAATVVLTIYSGANTKSYTLPIPGGITRPTWFQVGYADGGWAGSGNFTAVGAVKLTVSAAGAANVAIDFLRTSSTAAPAPPEATLTDVLLVDADNNGKPSPGDTIRYVARIKNNSGSAITGVQFSAPAVANASAAANITATPLARDDGPTGNSVPGAAYHTAFNTILNVSDGDADEDLLNNDFVGQPGAVITKFGGGTLGGTVDSNDAGASAAGSGHSLTVNGDGSFAFTPASGFAGFFTFDYRLANAEGSSVGTVSIAVGRRPEAFDDSYTALGNVQITQDAANGVLQKGTADSGDAIAVTTFGPDVAGVGNHSAGSSGLTAQGGNIALNADGSFSYNPPPGFTGNDSFVYKIDNGFAASDTGTVTITVSSTVWFINSAAAPGGDGRIATPFNSIAGYNASSPSKDAGDIIFIYEGAGSYSGSLTLANNQQLIGQGVDLAAATGLSVPAGSATLPGQSGQPTLGNAGTIVTLPTGGASTIRGVKLSPSAGFALLGTGAGTTVLTDSSITPTGVGGGVSLSAQGGSFTANSVAISANSSSAAVFVSGGSGGISFDGSGAISQSGAARVLDVQNRTGGTVTLAGNVSAGVASTGINIANNNSGNPTVILSGGSKVLNTGANTALSISGNTGATITFSNGGLDIDTTLGSGMVVSGSGTTINIAGSGNSINSTSATAISANGGSYSAIFDSVSSGGGANNISLTSIAGSVLINGGTLGGSSAGATNHAFAVSGSNASITYNGSIAKGNQGSLVNIAGMSGGSVALGGSLNGNGSSGITVANCTGGAITFSGGTKTLNTGNSAAVSLASNNGATVDFVGGGLDIDTTSGIGFNATGGGTVTVQGSGNTIATGTGTAINISGVNAGTGGIVFAATLSASGPVATISSSTGTKVLGRISTSGGGLIALNLNSAGLVNVGSSDGTKSAVSSSATAGTVVLNGTTLDLNGSGFNDGLNVTAMGGGVGVSCTGGTVNILGSELDITTASGTGFLAVSGGTVSLTDAGNSISSSSGTALNIANTTIGGNKVTFQSISSGAGANAGIILDNTGVSGGLVVTGLDGIDVGSEPDAGSGGVIASKTGSNATDNLSPATIVGTQGVGIFLRNTMNPSFAGMQLNNFSNYGIMGSGVSGFTLSYSVINGVTGDDISANDAVIHFQQLTGSALISHCTVQGGLEDNMRVVNTSGTLNRLMIDAVTFGAMDLGNATGDNGLLIQGRNSAVVNVTIQDSSISSARGDLFQLDLTDSATGDLVMKRNMFHNSHPNVVTGGGGVVLSGGGSASATPALTYDIGGATALDGNSFRGARGTMLLVLFQTGAGSATGKIRNNIFGQAGVDKSGSSEGSDIEIRTAGRAAQTTLISGNQILQYSNFGIYLQMGDQNVGGSVGAIGALNATVINNTISEPSSAGISNKNGVHANIGTTTGDTYQANLDIQNNAAGSSGSPDTGVGTDYVVRQRQNTSIGLPGYGGSSSDITAVSTYLQGRNTGTSTVFAGTQNANGTTIGYFNRSAVQP